MSLVSLTYAVDDPENLSAAEENRRYEAVEEAQILLQKGDECYRDGRYADAITAFSGARNLLPVAPVTDELRSAATERFALASVGQAKDLMRRGDISSAKSVIDQVIAPDVAPNHPEALALLAQLNDPIRVNPAQTLEHSQNVDSVRRLLYTADGSLQLGRYDDAIARYEEVLRIDPQNQAARRGMQRVAEAQASYGDSARDHTRAKLLTEVASQWEQAVPPAEAIPFEPTSSNLQDVGRITLEQKLERIILPRVELDQANLEEALDYLRVQAIENDNLGTDPQSRGINLNLNLSSIDEEAAREIRSIRFDLRLNNLPIGQILKYVCDITRTSYELDDYSVIIQPAGFTSEAIFTRSYRVSPDFLTRLSAGVSAENTVADNPFDEFSSGALLTTRLSAQEALAKQGVSFPDGASASYNAASNTLRVTNTAVNHDFISQIVETISQSDPVQVAVRVTMIRSEMSDLEELGFDWLVNPFALSSSDDLFASGGTVGNSGGRTPADFNNLVPGLPTEPNANVSSGVITNGLRSGDQAIGRSTIDTIMANPDRSAQINSVAPGVLAVTGLFSDGEAQMVIRGLSQKKNVDVMVKPSTVTRSGQASTLSVVREFIYPTEYEPPELPSSFNDNGGALPVTPATPTAFDKRDTGVILEVLPVAGADKQYVDITLSPSMVEFDGFINYGSPIRTVVQGQLGNGAQIVEVTANQILMPVFSTQQANTQLTVLDGSTIAIGGLLRESIENVEDKVPLLGDIPWLGRLFSSTARQPVRTAIVFFVQVELMDPTGRPYRDR
ncbi:MAG: Amuc_1098 family type IV pilus outer membrane protein [Luteolibacter sp.]